MLESLTNHVNKDFRPFLYTLEMTPVRLGNVPFRYKYLQPPQYHISDSRPTNKVRQNIKHLAFHLEQTLLSVVFGPILLYFSNSIMNSPVVKILFFAFAGVLLAASFSGAAADPFPDPQSGKFTVLVICFYWILNNMPVIKTCIHACIHACKDTIQNIVKKSLADEKTNAFLLVYRRDCQPFHN